MTKQIRISAKMLGELALPSFCPRCFWIKLHLNNRLPYQYFPGIFSHIDAYSKKITNEYFKHYHQSPRWFSKFGPLGEPIKVPHYNRFKILDKETNILLTGIPDEIFLRPNGSYFIMDYKTAKYTGTQDELFPMYEVQLNAYAYIAERIGLKPVSGLGLVYYEPLTDKPDEDITSFVRDNGFSMHFAGKLLSVSLKMENLRRLLLKARGLYELKTAPAGISRCQNCQRLDNLLKVTTRNIKPENN